MAPRSRSASHPVRALAALAVLVLVMLISITGKDTFNPSKWQSQFKVGLGLDLSSGTQVVLKAATTKGAPSAGAMQQAINVLESRVNGTGNSGAQVQQQGSDLINVTVPGKPAQSVIDLVSSTAKLSFRAVLLEQPYTGTATTTPSATPSATPSSGRPAAHASPTASPGNSTTPKASTSASPKASTNALSARLASPSSTPKSSTSAKATATPTASATPSSSSTAPASTTTYFGDASKVNAETMTLFNKLKCTPGPNANTVNDNWKSSVGYTLAEAPWDNPNIQVVSCDASGTKYVLDKAVFEGNQVTSVNTGLLQNSTQWVVNLSLDHAAAAAFGTLTTNQYNSYFSGYQSGNQDDTVLDSTAVVLDGNVQSAPVTQQPITAGQVQISGPQPNGFDEASATQLANILKYGSLPLTFTLLTVNSVSAQLGHSALVAGLIAGILGLALVVIYSFIYYRGLAVVSVSSLLIAALLAYLSVVLLSKYQNFTMSLSAIAGLVVAIGITADSFIVYFERLRDEVRDGKTLRPAVEAGWKRARRTILVSDTVSFLAAVLLYHFAVSDVQGFAYTLGLTTIIDVIVVFLFTKPMVTLLAGTEFYGGGHRWSGLDPLRLGAKAPWRSSARRTVRTTRTTSGIRSSGSSSTSTSREA
ncbi:MAG TPA: protein translocase subunit SecD [Trebonia sp.]|nr:protein translocase subunit SecD [Trebonia sp.]